MQLVRRISTDAHTIADILGQPVTYQVPFFQRDFVWTDEQIDALWRDVTMALADNRAEFALGTLVLNQSRDQETYNIVDGQQRLVFVSVLLGVVAKAWRKRRNRKRSDSIVQTYLTVNKGPGDKGKPKLRLKKETQPVYRDLLLKSRRYSAERKQKWSQSLRLLDRAYRRLDEHLVAWLETVDDVPTALNQLEEFVTGSVNLVVIETADASDAFVIFEILHNRHAQPASLAA